MNAPTAAGSGRALLAGGTVLALAMVIANVGNYALNLLLGRWLTPAEFSDANLMVTLMLTLTSIALCLQLVSARFIGIHDTAGEPERSDELARTLRRWGLFAGVVTGLLLAGPSVWWRQIFHTGSAWPFVILGLGMPFYLAQAVGRGVMQGRMRFRPLALTFVVEMVVRLGAGVLLVSLGFGVGGATFALTASFVATYVAVSMLGGRAAGSSGRTAGPPQDLALVRSYAGLVSILLIGQIIANNSDVLVAKAFFAPSDAGVYAAVALVGRAVFFLSWSVATVVFPAVAARHAGGGDTRGLLRGGIAAVLAIGLLCTVGAAVVGGPVLGVVLGPAYSGLSGYLAAYAAVTTMFAVANLVASHDLSQGRVGRCWLLLAASVLQVVLLLLWHEGMAPLIRAQGVAMAVLLVSMVLAPLVVSRRAPLTNRRAPAQ